MLLFMSELSSGSSAVICVVGLSSRSEAGGKPEDASASPKSAVDIDDVSTGSLDDTASNWAESISMNGVSADSDGS